MKIAATILLLLGVAVGIGFFMTRNTGGASVASPVPQMTPSAETVASTAPEPQVRQLAAKGPGITAPAVAASEAAEPAKAQVPQAKPLPVPVFAQALETLVSTQASYQQKQAAWGQLRDAGKLDQVIQEVEQRATANPKAPEYPATLGQAYLQKAGTIQDIREQGILGMKADQSFDAALNLDGSNWEARFWKATAMSYWPPQLGKGKDVIEHCLELIKQQEVQPAQPQYAQTYVLLGEQYQKQGHADYAKEVWKRGLGLFPQNETLLQRFNGTQ